MPLTTGGFDKLTAGAAQAGKKDFIFFATAERAWLP